MSKKVILSIAGNRFTQDDDDQVKLITQGSYYMDGLAYVLQYDESELSGMEGTTTTVRIEDGTVIMQRAGTHNSHFVFKNGQFFQGNYKTPFGEVQVGLYPVYLDYLFEEDNGRLDLEYRMELSGVETMNQIQISFNADNKSLI
jgi:uncharacterized beta-barrel protein YwiB (DUF1934 family)